LLILEGVPAILGGLLTYFLLPNRPAKAKFLTTEEKDWLTGELKREVEQKVSKSQISVGQTLVHGRVWHLTVAYFLALVGMYAMNFWMPQLVKALSTQRSNATVGMFVMIPYLAAVPAMILVSRSSDQTLERRYHIVIPEMVAAIALLLLGAITPHSAFLSVALWCFVASGIYCLLGPFWSLPSEFLTGFSAAAGIALINSFGNLGGFVGPYAMGAINKQTGSFRVGLLVAGISLFASAMLILALRKRIAPETEPIATAQRSPVLLTTPDIDS
jgi:MFS transporter, ACS family, tartrate transporter